MAVTRVIVTGAAGRMGRRLIDIMRADPDLSLAGAVAPVQHAALGRDIGEVAGIGPVGIALTSCKNNTLPDADVIVDFSTPEAALMYLGIAASQGQAMVIGTTGFTTAQREEIDRLSQTTPCFLAPNMSVGVHVMGQVLQQLVRLLGPEYDIEILEAHHRTKIDAPSGTALRLASLAAEARGTSLAEVGIYGRHGMVGRRSDIEIGIQAVRAGDIVGEHTVILGGIGERLELIHRSHSRDTFARGALRAAKWLVAQPPGLYGMEDLLPAV